MIRALAIAAVTALVVTATAVAPAAAEPASPEERAAAIARPAVVSVEVSWHGWVRDPRTGEVFGGPSGYSVTSRCSGVVVAENGYVATAAHCVDPGPAGGGGALVDLALTELTRFGRVGDLDQARAQLTDNAVVEGSTAGTPVRREVRVERVTGTFSRPEHDVAPATVVDLLPTGDGDVAVLKIPRDRLAVVEVADEDALPAGTPVLAIGYPAAAEEATDPGTEPSNKNGQISTRRSVSGSPYYEISAAASPGMSGGPVVDMSGRVIGLVSAAPKGETQPFNLVTASSSIWKVLRGEDIGAAPTANDRNFVAGLDRYYDGDYPAAVEFFDAVLAATPSHRQAAEYRRLAAEHGTGGLDVLLLLIIGCAAVAVGTAAAGVVLLRRGHRVPTPPFGFPPPVQVMIPSPVPAPDSEQPTVPGSMPGTTRPRSGDD
jgi:serine protease Do